MLATTVCVAWVSPCIEELADLPKQKLDIHCLVVLHSCSVVRLNKIAAIDPQTAISIVKNIHTCDERHFSRVSRTISKDS